jgi:hypothetical protein
MATLYKNKGGIPESEKGQAGGVATLDETGKVPLSQIPGGLGQGTVDSINDVFPDENGDVTLTTTDIPEGNKLYWTQTRFNDASASISQSITTLQGDLSDEITNRTNADNALDTRITSLEGEIVNKASNNDLSALDTRVTTAESDIDDLQADMLSKASSNDLSALDTRVTTAEGDIDDLQADILTLTAGVDLRALEADLQSEITNRTNADNALDLRLDDVEAHHLHSNSYYVNDGINDFQTILTEIGADQGNVIYASAGSFGGATLEITDKGNLGIICPNAGNTICELAGGRGLSIGGTSERIRITNLQIEGATSITGTKGRHIFQSVQFLGGLTIDGVTDSSATFMTFTDCEFANQNILISNLTNCTIYFNRCSFSNLRIIPSNVASPFLIIVSECSGLNTLQTNLTSGVVIAGRTGYSNNTVKVFTTSANFISALGVETSFTGSYSELRDKPTLITASTQLSDSSDLLRTADKGVANGVAELDANGLIPNHHIPPLALTKPYVVQTIAERNALTGINTGDVAIVVNDPTPSNNGNYIYDSDAPGWIALYNSTSPISSVNGQIGAVTLYTGDISEGQGAQGEASKLYFTDSRALSASVTNDIDDLNKAPNAPTVKLYVTGLTDALDSRVDTLESTVLNFATTTYVDNGLAGKLDSTSYTASDVLTKIKTVDGSGSGLDADLLDGLDSSDFVRMTNAQTVAGVKTFSSSPIVPDLSASDNSTKATNSKYVDSAISALDTSIKAYYTAGTGISLTSGAIASTITQYTDELAQDASASLFTGGTHTGISYSYVDNSNVINSTVSLSGFSINALSDVDTSTTTPTNGQALVWESASSLWKPGTVSGGGGGGGDITFGTDVSANNTVLTLSASNTMYLVNNTTNAWTVYLPAISSVTGRRLLIKRMGTGLVTIARNASDTSVNIDFAGQTSIDMGAQYSTFELVANASNNMWYLI